MFETRSEMQIVPDLFLETRSQVQIVPDLFVKTRSEVEIVPDFLFKSVPRYKLSRTYFLKSVPRYERLEFQRMRHARQHQHSPNLTPTLPPNLYVQPLAGGVGNNIC